MPVIEMPAVDGVKSFKVGKIHVAVNDRLEKGQDLMHVEAGKESRAIKAADAGIVAEILVKEGETVSAGTPLIRLDEADAASASAELLMPEISGTAKLRIGKIRVKAGDSISAGQELVQIEAGKTARTLKADADGIIEAVLVCEGESYAAGTVLLRIAPAAAVEASKQQAPANTQAVQCDLLIIGAGTGGYVAAIRAAKAGKSVILAEKNKLGGTCLNIGCIPTKTLIASAHRFEEALHSAEFGIDIQGEIKPDMPRIIHRKDQVVGTLVSGVEYLMQKNGIRVVRGEAAFTDAGHVHISGSESLDVTFTDCIIATGSDVTRPPIPGIDSPLVMDSTAALSEEKLPKTVAIIGGGVIGLEFAFLYNDLGVEVTVLEYLDRLVSMVDRDISEAILEIARKRGIRVELTARVTRFTETVNGQVVTTYEKGGKEYAVSSDRALVAIGRHPYMEGLGLENTGIILNERGRGIATDEHMRTNVAHIYAVGDVNNRVQLAHAASYQGMIAVADILGESTSFDAGRIPSVIFTRPEIATVGLGEDQAQKAGIAYKVGHFHFSGNGKALSMGETEGYIKLLMDENETLIGGSIIGPDASTLIASLGICIANKMKVSDLENTVFAHPTTAEVIHEAALDLTLGAFHE